MTSQTGKITRNILPGISKGKDNLTMKFNKLIEPKLKYFLHVENESGRLVPELFFLLKALL